LCALSRELAQDVVQDAAVAEVLDLLERIDAAMHRHLAHRAVGRGDLHLHAPAAL
jgi:hypothetical protein